MQMMRSRSAVLDFVDDVTGRYGSLEAFFTQLRADLDDEPTVVLPILIDVPTEPMGWSAVKRPAAPTAEEMPAPEVVAAADVDPVDKGRKGAAALWGRLLGRR
ncbi:hypothetical protein GV794_27160 [Nocardia cyriacigeorgica]|uniref:Uncharacterized protein n=1 Tax=Nocardia cyriacigeorgica TaxID=135487 RepID=A0A6P1DEH1_9NOCA|nr:hypothetical protein [Nocardia cyriacigeorgica]NEW37551.1 hypothetical protein [Nocardia cyriacigeorgica]NEW47879.1 hypothetical protein [Nocardia cyriacigeorgica]NEW49061.1 hypothetical protein [Nocardia cyriacigeorgica]NEW59284.1 hypothetical protein [Nocardia cyriacigeorgica]